MIKANSTLKVTKIKKGRKLEKMHVCIYALGYAYTHATGE